MNADSNVETIKAIYESFGRGDVAAILDSCTDDVDWTTEAAGDDAPWWGQRIGKEAVSGFFTAITDATEVTEFHSAQLRRQRRRPGVADRNGREHLRTRQRTAVPKRRGARSRAARVQPLRRRIRRRDRRATGRSGGSGAVVSQTTGDWPP